MQATNIFKTIYLNNSIAYSRIEARKRGP
jgi:hypothetical protein